MKIVVNCNWLFGFSLEIFNTGQKQIDFVGQHGEDKSVSEDNLRMHWQGISGYCLKSRLKS